MNGNITITTSDVLPSGYTQLEYIQSTGIQCINTGINPNYNSRVIMMFKHTSFNSPSALFGARDATTSKNFNLWEQADLYGAQYNGNDWSSNQKSVSLSNVKCLHDFNKNTCTVNGVSSSFTYTSFSCSYPLYLLAVNSGGTIDERMSIGCLYYCKMYSNGTLVRDFIPAKNSSNVVGLYDWISGTFFTNAGSGSFTAGPVVG